MKRDMETRPGRYVAMELIAYEPQEMRQSRLEYKRHASLSDRLIRWQPNAPWRVGSGFLPISGFVLILSRRAREQDPHRIITERSASESCGQAIERLSVNLNKGGASEEALHHCHDRGIRCCWSSALCRRRRLEQRVCSASVWEGQEKARVCGANDWEEKA